VQKSSTYANVEYDPPQFTDAEVTVTGPALFASGLPLEITPDPVDLSAWLDTDRPVHARTSSRRASTNGAGRGPCAAPTSSRSALSASAAR
jgi:hypothetical protein